MSLFSVDSIPLSFPAQPTLHDQGLELNFANHGLSSSSLALLFYFNFLFYVLYFILLRLWAISCASARTLSHKFRSELRPTDSLQWTRVSAHMWLERSARAIPVKTDECHIPSWVHMFTIIISISIIVDLQLGIDQPTICCCCCIIDINKQT